MAHTRAKRILWRAFGLLVLLVLICAGILYHYFGPFSIRAGARPEEPAPMARWPWPHAKTDNPHPGVTHWIDRSSSDGTVLELFDFDFRKNPHLRLELYDQDEDDRVPFDDRAEFHARAVGQATSHLNRIGRGRVVAAWNGLLIVKEPGSESASLRALAHRLPLMGGWTVADLQRFWRDFGAWCAVNVDGGDVTQLAALRRDGRYDLVPARWASGSMRLTLPADLSGAPAGGSMMYFFIRDASAR